MRKLLFALLLLPLFVGSCAKIDPTDPTPKPESKEYLVEYQVTARYADQADIEYRDSTGTVVSERNVSLPKTYLFKRTPQRLEAVAVGALLADGEKLAELTCAIKLDGVLVRTRTVTGSGPEVRNFVFHLIE